MKFDIWKKISKSETTGSTRYLADLLEGREWGYAVRREGLEMIPLFGSLFPDPIFAPPAEALRLTKVTGYGNMILENKTSHPPGRRRVLPKSQFERVLDDFDMLFAVFGQD